MKRTAFDLFHPVVAFGYFAVMFALSMTAMQPVYLAISLASVLSYSAVLCGWRATGRSLLWQLPLVAVGVRAGWQKRPLTGGAALRGAL